MIRMEDPKPLDLALISGRRPDLLRSTLDSFATGLFSRFSIRGVYVNLDPVFGDAADHAECVHILRARFPDAVIFQPEHASFGAAVQRTWGATRSDLVFHLEDDWLLNEPVGPRDVAPLMTGDTKSIALVAKELGWNGSDIYNQRRKKLRFLGLPVGTRTFQVFGTSPRFIDGEFARSCAALMDPELDPEKQMRSPGNPRLIGYVQQFKCRYLGPKNGLELISDIGRAWRDRRGIEKVVENARSVWTNAGPASGVQTRARSLEEGTGRPARHELVDISRKTDLHD